MSGTLPSSDQTRELQGMKSDLARIADAVRSASANQAREGLDRVKLAREWAKIRKLTEEMRRDLLWLEALCLRRLAQLDALDQVPANFRPAARHFATLDDVALSALINAATKASSASAAYRQWLRGEEVAEDRRRTTRWIYGDDRSFLGESQGTEIHALMHAQDVRGALAVVMEDAIGRDLFTVSDMVEQIIESELPDRVADVGVREGIAEVVRRAIRNAPLLTTEEGEDLPRFITCQHPEHGCWVRVPIERARVGQFKEMVALRRTQLEMDATALSQLESVGAFYDIEFKGDDEFLLPTTYRASQPGAA